MYMPYIKYSDRIKTHQKKKLIYIYIYNRIDNIFILHYALIFVVTLSLFSED